MLKTVLKRGIILGIIIVLIACLGGIAPLDIPILMILGILVILLGIVSYISNNHRKDDSDE